MELFKQDRQSPLAWRMQPGSLDEFIGQAHILDRGKPLREAIERDRIASLVLYGPPGTGKTALSRLIAKKTVSHFVSLNAVTSGVAEVKRVLKDARNADRTILFIDEIHRFNKLQQDALLPDVENGTVTLIGASTQNPFFAIIPALSSRSMIFQLYALSTDEIKTLLERALADNERGLGKDGVVMEAEALEFLAVISEGDARKALNALEMGAFILSSREKKSFGLELAREVMQKKGYSYSRDEHYDTISAFIKSMRGSDPDAVLYWLARMIDADEDPLFIARRIVICASEDIGNADPGALQVAVAAYSAVEAIGMPEGRIPLAQAAIYMAMAPKSNAAYRGIDMALASVREKRLKPVPVHLKGTGYSGASRLGAGVGYKYPHNYENHHVDQEYMAGKDVFYIPADQGYEKILKKTLDKRRSTKWTAH